MIPIRLALRNFMSYTDVHEPLQEGLHFHALYSAKGHDVYTVQMILELAGEVDAARLRQAGEAVLERHSNLRASFEHEYLNEPVQVIAREVKLPWTEVDLSDQPETLAAQVRGRHALWRRTVLAL